MQKTKFEKIGKNWKNQRGDPWKIKNFRFFFIFVNSSAQKFLQIWVQHVEWIHLVADLVKFEIPPESALRPLS